MASNTRISVLGPVRAWQGGEEVPLGGRQQRGVLAVLAAAGGDPVPTDTLIHAMWPGSPPRTAVNVVQTYVKRLRQLLDPGRPARATSGLLPCLAGGYALRAAPDAVDLWQFRHLVACAQQARQAGDPRQVVRLLTAALKLWRGQPAAGLVAVAGHPPLAAATDERWSAVALLAEAALACGRAGEVVNLVADAASTAPHNELLQAHLVRLYHRVGRRTDAVRVFHATRQRLQQEFGLDPGPQLVAAYRAMLRDERALLAGV